ncbi:inositol hexaphosphate kinase 3 [Zopfia rhizophila CBS 207.26]|uniref:Kinase n=1 Tax=Zopfia rhizophila CBS 207.26 TaxID=1314779 RepID=A0A6A6EC16_9PEZI|nr:inositol hexaphosphate kinase 3 [Zopfia rhizophila CBS 207.26]
MSKKAFDPSSLRAFGNVAAGHDGVLSDESGIIIAKPCTEAEIQFYQSVQAEHPDLAPHLPTFMGTLQVSSDQTAVSGNVESGMIQTANGLERLHGRRLETEQHIVLENITYGFKKPNILDLKLGAQLWDEHAEPEKRAKLDEISAATTSGSLGFRIAGMRTFKGAQAPKVDEDLKEFVDKVDQSGYWVLNKMYGRKFSAANVPEGFLAYILPQSESKAELERAKEVLTYFLGEVKDIQKAFESKESRMYSASILLVYEGDLEEYAKTKEILTAGTDVEEPPKLAAVKMIDFAHATWHPGKGPDENSIRGMRSTVKILEDLLKKVDEDTARA